MRAIVAVWIGAHCLAAPQALHAQELFRPTPGRSHLVSPPRANPPPDIDGRLDEGVWLGAAVADGFWASELQQPPPDDTIVLVLADEEWLYVGFRAFDDVPDEIEAQQTRRNADIGFDDHVTIELDTFNNAREISRFSVNALGTQFDDLAGGRARNIGWRGDWRAAAVRTRYGWSAEIAIPLAMLNYPERATSFGVNFARFQNRTAVRSWWVDVTPQIKPEERGILAGLQLRRPDASPLALMPYVLAGVNSPDKEGNRRDHMLAGGADIRYRPRADLTGVLSLNPDFSTLEEQFANINFSYTEKAVTDTRPFFQEGAKYLDPGRNRLYFYSNRIPNFDVGAKGFGRLGTTQFGAFATAAPDGRKDYALRLLRELGATRSAALSVYASAREGLDNTLAVGQLSGRERNGLTYSADLATSRTRGEAGDGNHLQGTIGYASDYAYASATGDYYGRTFLPADGLLPDDLPGTRGASASTGYYRVYASGPLYALRGDVSLGARETLQGELQRRNLYLGGYLELRNQVRPGLYYSRGSYRPVTSTPGVFEPEANDDHYWSASLDFNTRNGRMAYGLSYSDGSLGGGKYRYLPAYVWIRPRPDLYLSLTGERLESFGRYNQAIAVVRWDATPEDSLGGRVVVSDGDTYWRLTYGRQVRSGVDVLAVLDSAPDSPTQFAVKLQLALP